MRRVLFTESQLKEILGEEEFSSYLPNYGEEIPSTDSNVANYEEIIPTDNIDNKIPHTADYDSHQRIQTSYWAKRAQYGLYENNKKKELNERSEATANFHSGIGKTTKNSIIQSHTNNKMLKNMVNGKGDNLGAMETRLCRMRKNKKANPVAYAQNGGKQMEKTLRDVVNHGQNASRDINKTKTIDPIVTANINNGTGKGNHKSVSQTVYYDNN